MTIQYPQLISNMVTSGHMNLIKSRCLTFFFTPFLRLLMNLKMHVLDLQEKLQIDTADHYKEKSIVKYHLRNMGKLELGLETIYQLQLQLILLFNALSKTRTNEGFNVIFEDGQNVWSTVLLTLSSIWSFVSCSMSHIQGLSLSRDHFPVVSKLLIGLYALLSVFKRVLCVILYFTPSLGLFSLLR